MEVEAYADDMPLGLGGGAGRGGGKALEDVFIFSPPTLASTFLLPADYDECTFGMRVICTSS